ncbi:Putative HTH-type transcriptional regulator [Modestobacter italicus]|uniref:HTH-type transcriptional regulator n=1 Tax=Modestobacter italicus (strain DSM 44449 / CECT 9708 / BC 501) TaxID=2732864 RepID=I4F0F0_MODI5|nr:Putative HTH-type transcriptional regulator [Modestobacter marinus]
MQGTPRDTGRGKRRPGRPRHDGSVAQGSARDTIIRVATALFAERGYASTTITEIASAAGLQQSSFYYYFRSKEEILHATLALNRQALAFADDLAERPESAAVRLYELLRYDTLQLCISPFDFNEIERLAEAQPADFVDFWRDYQKLHEHVQALINAGIQLGDFNPCDAELAATAALCLNEGVQKRYRSKNAHDPDSLSPFSIKKRTAEEYADTSAKTTLAALVVSPATLSLVREQVMRTSQA